MDAAVQVRRIKPPPRWRPWWTAPILDPIDDEFSIAELTLPLQVDTTLYAAPSSASCVGSRGVGPKASTYRSVEPLDEVRQEKRQLADVLYHAPELPAAERQIVRTWAEWKLEQQAKSMAARLERERAAQEAYEQAHQGPPEPPPKTIAQVVWSAPAAPSEPTPPAKPPAAPELEVFRRGARWNREGDATRLAHRIMSDEEFLEYLKERQRQRALRQASQHPPSTPES